MSLRNYIALACVAVSASAFAQSAQLGSISRVSGAVTVSSDVSAGAATVGTPVFHGTRVVTAGNGSATLNMNNGCVVKLEPSRSLTIVKNMPCQAMNAAASRGSKDATGGSTGDVGTGDTVIIIR